MLVATLHYDKKLDQMTKGHCGGFPKPNSKMAATQIRAGHLTLQLQQVPLLVVALWLLLTLGHVAVTMGQCAAPASADASMCWLRLENGTLPFDNATQACVAAGSELAIIRSQSEHNAARSECRSSASGICWLSARDSGDGTYSWTGKPPPPRFYNCACSAPMLGSVAFLHCQC